MFGGNIKKPAYTTCAEVMTGNLHITHSEVMTGNLHMTHSEVMTGNLHMPHSEVMTGNLHMPHSEVVIGNLHIMSHVPNQNPNVLMSYVMFLLCSIVSGKR
jgi:hypothetical protein